MRTILAIAVLIPTTAHAECLQWGRTLNGNERVCIMDDAVNRNPVIPEISTMGPHGTTNTNSPAPRCPEGYSLILRSSGSPACARDIIDPQQ